MPKKIWSNQFDLKIWIAALIALIALLVCCTSAKMQSLCCDRPHGLGYPKRPSTLAEAHDNNRWQWRHHGLKDFNLFFTKFTVIAFYTNMKSSNLKLRWNIEPITCRIPVAPGPWPPRLWICSLSNITIITLSFVHVHAFC